MVVAFGARYCLIMNPNASVHAGLGAALLMASTLCAASSHAVEVNPLRCPSRLQHQDRQFAHNQCYFQRGLILGFAPTAGEAVDSQGAHYWYQSGEWYGRIGLVWVVVAAPIGAFVNHLPTKFTTVWLTVPYYYANSTFYVWDRDRARYQVVAEPRDIKKHGEFSAPRIALSETPLP